MVKRKAKNNGIETQVSSREQLMDMLMDSVDEVFLVLSGDKFNTEYVSPNIDQLLGVTIKEVERNVENLGCATYIDDRVVTYQTLKDIPVGSYISLIGGREHKRTKEQRYYSETIKHVIVQSAHKYIVRISDMTSVILAQQSLEEALTIAKVANQSKNKFLANMSRDIRTPMNTIVGLSTLIQRDAEESDKVKEYAKNLVLTSRHMLTLVNDIFDMSNIESDGTTISETEVSLLDVIKEINAKIASQVKAKKLILDTTVAVKDTRFLGDELKIKRILMNLLSNAVQYTPNGGRVEFTVEQMVRPSLKNVYLQFVVKDNGVGMSEDFVNHIFEPFAKENGQIKSIGSGLGLAITKNLVDLMSGTIDVKSVKGEGSTFTVSFKFPLSKTNDTRFWTEYGISRILVVSNNNMDNHSIAMAMRKSGVGVSFAKSTKAAEANLEKTLKDGKGPNVVLVEWLGEEQKSLQKIRDISSDISEYIPVIVFGDCEWKKVEKMATEAGADAFLPKPFLLANLKECIKKLKDNNGDTGSIHNSKSVLEGMNFLAAEDNELNAMVLCELLKTVGATCVVKSDGKACLYEFENSGERQYDAILMDINMPVMDGLETAKAIRVCSHIKANSVPIIAMTANAFAEDAKKSMDAGMNAHLLKPVNLKRLEEIFFNIKNRKV